MTLNIRLIFALFITFVLTILPLPGAMTGFRPLWILMFVLYVQFSLPNYFSITLLFFIGLCLDVLLSTIIGEHGFALLLATWFAAGKARRFNFFSIIQQVMVVSSCCFVYQFFIFLIDSFLGYNNSPWMVVGTVLLSICFWPWIVWALGNGLLLRRQV